MAGPGPHFVSLTHGGRAMPASHQPTSVASMSPPSEQVEKIVKIHLKRLGIVYILTVIFLSKSECPDKMRPRAGHIGIGPPKLISFKTRHDLHSVEKKSLSKNSKIMYQNSY